MTVYDLVARLVLAVAFGQALVPKVRDIARFERAVANYQLVPHRIVPPVARLIVVIECVAFVSLAMGVELDAGALIASVLLLGFAAAISINLLRGRHFDCGCAGRTSEQISWPIESWRVGPEDRLRPLPIPRSGDVRHASSSRRCSRTTRRRTGLAPAVRPEQYWDVEIPGHVAYLRQLETCCPSWSRRAGPATLTLTTGAGSCAAQRRVSEDTRAPSVRRRASRRRCGA